MAQDTSFYACLRILRVQQTIAFLGLFGTPDFQIWTKSHVKGGVQEFPLSATYDLPFVGNQCMILFTDFICSHLLLFTFNKHHILSPYGHNSLSPFPFSFPQFSEVHIHSTLFHFYLTYSFMYLAPMLGQLSLIILSSQLRD